MNDVTVIKGQTVEYAQSYKYLGTITDSKLNFEADCEAVCKKAHQRLYCLRKLSYFHIDRTITTMFYRVFSFQSCLFLWFHGLVMRL